MKLHICGLAETIKLRRKFTHIVSVIETKFASSIPDLGIPPERRLVLFCDDVSSPDPRGGIATRPPTKKLVKKALSFASKMTVRDSLLIHCVAGISRSTAIAYAILCQANPRRSEEKMLRDVVKLRPDAYPNSSIVEFADELLEREGRMQSALEAFRLDPNAFMAAAGISR